MGTLGLKAAYAKDIIVSRPIARYINNLIRGIFNI